MPLSINDYYLKVKDLVKKDEFLELIDKIKKESGELFDDTICALMIIDQFNRNENNYNKISSLDAGMESTVMAKIIKIGETKEFIKKNGKNGSVLKVDISDQTGICKLVLWDRDIIKFKNTFKINSFVKIINGYVKKSYDGIEINIGRWSLFELVNEEFINKFNFKNNNSIYGKILEIQPTRPFFKNNGEYGFCTSVKIIEKNKIKKLFIWDKNVKEIQKYKSGDFVKFEGVILKNKNGIIENHVESNGLIKGN